MVSKDTNKVVLERKRGRPRVPLSRIVDEALALVDSEGPEALSMRTLAGRLGTGTAVLYRAVSNRDELIAMVIDSVIGDTDFDFSTESDEVESLGDERWKRTCAGAATALYDALARHPGVASLLVEQIPTGPNASVVRERMLALLLASGFSPADAALVFVMLSRFVIGFAAQLRAEVALRNVDPATMQQMFSALPVESFPSTVAVADSLPHQTLDGGFRFALSILVEGLAGRRRGRIEVTESVARSGDDPGLDR